MGKPITINAYPAQMELFNRVLSVACEYEVQAK